MNKRQAANLEILAMLLRRTLDNPDERFGQMLRNIGAIVETKMQPLNPAEDGPIMWCSHFNEESEATMVRMNIRKEQK